MRAPPPIFTIAGQTVVVSGTDPNGNAAYAGRNPALPPPNFPAVIPDPPLPVAVSLTDPVTEILESQLGVTTLILGFQKLTAQHPKRLVFWQEGRSVAEALPPGHLHVQYVTHEGLRSVVLLGDNFGDSNVVFVQVDTPLSASNLYVPLQSDSWPSDLWMGDPEPFRAGAFRVQWLDENMTVLHERNLTLAWGDPYP
jgi:hypothetical protein